jgi:hypothetical protein
MRVAIFLALSLVLLATTASAQSPDSVKLNHVRQLVDLMGSGRLGVQAIGSILDEYKKAMPNVPPEFWDELMKEIKPDELVDLIIPIYAKYFTDDDILQMSIFYNSPVGKKVIKTLPVITQEGMNVGKQWGQQLVERVQEKLRLKGYLKNG